MSKAILVMDIPKSCDMCDFVTVDGMVGNMTCTNPLSDEYGCDVTDYIDCRAGGCPLKEVPKKKKDTLMTNYSRYVRGWNDCIDRILEGSEEDE